MITLPHSLAAWPSPSFKQTLKTELEAFDAEQLPLQQGLANSSYVSHEPFHVIIMSISEQTHALQVRIGVSYSGIIAGCSCADDPAPLDVQTEYCEMLLSIDRQTANTQISLITD